MFTNIELLKELQNTEFSSIEVCYRKEDGLRLAVKSYSVDIIYKFIKDKPDIIKLLNNILLNSCSFGILEYGISFDKDIVKIYYIDNMKVIGIDIDVKTCTIFRTKHYSILPNTYNIEVCEYDSDKHAVGSSTYEVYDDVSKIPIDEFKCFTGNCQYAYNKSKNQYYVRVYKEQFMHYYDELLALYTN